MNKYEQIIDRLASKELSPGLMYIDQEYNIKRILDNGAGYTIDYEHKKNKHDVIHEGGVLFLDDYSTRLKSQNNICFSRNRRVKKLLGHEIMLGDILNMITEVHRNKDDLCTGKILTLWRLCITNEEGKNGETGLPKSLQQIYGERMNKNAKNLFTYINSLL